MQTIEQKIAQKEAQLNRLRKNRKSLDSGQKIIIGGMMLSMAENNPIVASKLLEWINREVKRPQDLKRLTSIIDKLKIIASKKETSNIR